MNRGEIRTLVRLYLNEPNAAFWSDATLNTYIDIAVKKVHDRIKAVSRYHFTTRATFQTTIGAEYYQFPADMKHLKLVTRIDPTSGRELPLSRADWPDPFINTPDAVMDNSGLTGEDVPNTFWIVGASFRLLPIPQAVDTMRLYYEARLTNLGNDQAIPSFDSDYHDMAAKWAAIEARPQNKESSADLMALYGARDADLIQDVLHRVPAPPGEVENYLQGIAP